VQFQINAESVANLSPGFALKSWGKEALKEIDEV
jgi:hypothetical protein